MAATKYWSSSWLVGMRFLDRSACSRWTGPLYDLFGPLIILKQLRRMWSRWLRLIYASTGWSCAGLLKLCTLMEAKSWLADLLEQVADESKDAEPESGCFHIACARTAFA